jgi:carboxyl-terminal processing protease
VRKSSFLYICITTFSAAFIISPVASAVQTLSTPLPLDQLRLFAEVFGQIKREYVKPVDDDKLLTAAIKGMVSSLDPHSAFVDKTDFQEFQERITGSFAGVGIEIGSEEGLVKVIAPIDDTPAFRAGIHPGDLITSIDKKPVKGMTSDHAASILRGNPGTKVTLTLYRKSEDRTFPVTVTRAIIKVQSVKTAVPAPGYAYVRITSFQERTTPDLAAKLRAIALTQPNLKGLILDLRDNGGGLVESAVGVAGAFLPSDAIVVTTNGQAESSKRAYRDNYVDYRLPSSERDPLKNEPAIFKKVPLVVLTNAYTASASEIVAGALQDASRATILGKTTFGKGSVQTAVRMTSDSALRLTSAYYYTPKGRSIQDVGIRPDILVDQFADGDPDDALATREADVPNHLANIQDPNEKKELEARQQERIRQMSMLEARIDAETPEQRVKERNRTPVEFGSIGDFVMQQALNKLQGKPVIESKALIEGRLAQSETSKSQE